MTGARLASLCLLAIVLVGVLASACSAPTAQPLIAPSAPAESSSITTAESSSSAPAEPIPTATAELLPTATAELLPTATAEPAQGAMGEPARVATAASNPAPTSAPAPVPPTPVPAVAATAAPPAQLALKPLPAGPRRIGETPPPPVTAEYVAIVDEVSGEVLFGQSEHTRVAPASITKIATTLVALEHEPNVERRVAVTISGSAMAARDGSSIMGLEPGEDVSVRTLLYGMMLPSGNDAAEQIALALAPAREAYVDWMNQRASALGLLDTHFVNPSGMDASGHYSSAFDMAMLGREAMRNDAFRALAGAASYRGDGYRLSNLNRLIGVYPGADGIKIGSTRRAGKTIVASATRAGHRVYIALLRSSDLPGDSTTLFNWVWRSFAW